MHQIISYIKFLIKSTNQHGVHSPFVYDLITKCFYDKTKHSAYAQLQAYRNSLLASNNKLTITDFGAGSKQLDSKERSISDMAKGSGSSIKNSKLLFRISNYFKFNTLLELGTSLGIGTQAFTLSNSNTKIKTIEGCPNTLEFTKQKFNELDLNTVKFINSDFQSAISDLDNQTFDCIFFDGHHTKAATLNYFNLLLSNAHNDSVFIFDDIYWSKDMTEAWEIICQDQRVTVSIDTFHFGFVFFRTEQPKQHFRIRV